jgi:hypothetical protein
LSFDFLGTFTASQFTRFSDWVRAQTAQIDDRVLHLQAELDRIGAIAFAFDSGGVPTNLSSGDSETYAGKLFLAYEALGGDAFYDLQIRSMNQAVFRLEGSENGMPQQMSNGEILGTPGLSDQESAELVRSARDWTYDALFYRREYLERKIRRMIDYADQLQAEIDTLNQIKAQASVQGALGFILNGVQQLISDRTYLAAQNDSGKPDPHGKMAYAPFASYMPGPKRANVTDFERTYDGPVVPTGDGQ